MLQPTPSPAAAPVPADGQALGYHGQGLAVLSIHAENLVLTLATLGGYYFWGKARLQSYLYSQLSLLGDRFAYLGTGWEFLLGWLRASVLFAIVAACHGFADWTDQSELQALGFLLGYIMFFVLAPVVTVGAWRFRLARSAWRGIRFSFRGTVRAYAWRYWGGAMLCVVSLGFYYPLFLIQTRQYLVENSYYGQARFTYDGRPQDFFGPLFVLWLFWLPTLGFTWFWWRAWKENYDWAHTRLGSVRFKSQVTSWGLLGLWVSNAALIVGTLGLAWPWTRMRSVAYRLTRLQVIAEVNWDGFMQDERLSSATGEEIGELMGASFFDGGLGL